MDKIILRALTSQDLNDTLRWHNQEDIRMMYSGHPFPVNLELEQKWYEKILTSNFPTTVFGISIKDSSTLIGISMLKDINMINRVAEFAIYIGDENYRGKGYSYEATLETLNFAFNQLGLNRIFLKVLQENDAAIKLYLKAGFQKEGVLRKAVFKNNEYKDEFIMSILEAEYQDGKI